MNKNPFVIAILVISILILLNISSGVVVYNVKAENFLLRINHYIDLNDPYPPGGTVSRDPVGTWKQFQGGWYLSRTRQRC